MTTYNLYSWVLYTIIQLLRLEGEWFQRFSLSFWFPIPLGIRCSPSISAMPCTAGNPTGWTHITDAQRIRTITLCSRSCDVAPCFQTDYCSSIPLLIIGTWYMELFPVRFGVLLLCEKKNHSHVWFRWRPTEYFLYRLFILKGSLLYQWKTYIIVQLFSFDRTCNTFLPTTWYVMPWQSKRYFVVLVTKIKFKINS